MQNNELIIVDDVPFLFWDNNIHNLNLEFINSIDSSYFNNLTKHLELIIQNCDQIFTNKIVFMHYYHSLETLFSLLCSSIQAPNFFYGWILHCNNTTLRNLVNKILRNNYFKNKFNLSIISWEVITNIIYSIDDKNWNPSFNKPFEKYWKELSYHFVNDYYFNAYNAQKHGFRNKVDSITQFEFGDKNNKFTIDNNFFGLKSSFSKNIEESNKHNKLLLHQYLHFNPEKLIQAIDLIAISINNIKYFLLHFNKANIENTSYIPLTDKWIEKYDKHVLPDLRHLQVVMDLNYNKPLLNKDELYKMY